MPMQGSKPSKLSKDLGNVVAQLKSKKTRGANPRDLEPEEIVALEQKRDALKAQMKQMAKERTVARVNGHTTAEADRVIGAVHAATASADAYFNDIGGRGSPADLHLRGKALIERAKEMSRQEKRKQEEDKRAATRAAKQARKQELNAKSPEELCENLRGLGLETTGKKSALVQRLLSAAPGLSPPQADMTLPVSRESASGSMSSGVAREPTTPVAHAVHGEVCEKPEPSAPSSVASAATNGPSPISTSEHHDFEERAWWMKPSVCTWLAMQPAAPPRQLVALKGSALKYAWYPAQEQDSVRVICSLSQALPSERLQSLARELPRNVDLTELLELACVVVEHDGRERILPTSCLEPAPETKVVPLHCLPKDILFETALFATSWGKRKSAERRADKERRMKEVRVAREEDLCQFEVAPGRRCSRPKPCLAAHGGPGVQCASVLESDPEKRCRYDAMEDGLYCSSHAPAPNLGPIMHQVFLHREDAPTHAEVAQFARQHFPQSDQAEVKCRVDAFCARIRDGRKRRRTQ